jgi:hypothetical protein
MAPRRMLAAALQAEVAAYIEAHADQLDADGHRLVVRNGSHQPREVMTAAGARAAGQRQTCRRRDRRTQAVFLDDPAGLVAQVPAAGRGVATAVPARAVD